MIGILTLVYRVTSHAIFPMFVEHFWDSRAALGFAVAASTMGMAATGVAVSLFAHRIDFCRDIWLSPILFSIPNLALISAPDRRDALRRNPLC